MREAPKYTWLPEGEVAAVLARPDRAARVVAVEVPNTGEGAGVVLLVRGDGRLVEVPADAFRPCGNGVRPDFMKARVADYGLTVAFGAYEAAADAALDDGRVFGEVFDPADYDGSKPDVHATPEQLAWLDRAVAVAPRVGGPEFSEADGVEWRAVTAGLRATLNMYGCEWIHRGWDLMLHGNMIFADRFTPEYSLTMTAWWDEFLSRPKSKLVTKRLPVADVSCLD